MVDRGTNPPQVSLVFWKLGAEKFQAAWLAGWSAKVMKLFIPEHRCPLLRWRVHVTMLDKNFCSFSPSVRERERLRGEKAANGMNASSMDTRVMYPPFPHWNPTASLRSSSWPCWEMSWNKEPRFRSSTPPPFWSVTLLECTDAFARVSTQPGLGCHFSSRQRNGSYHKCLWGGVPVHICICEILRGGGVMGHDHSVRSYILSSVRKPQLRSK